MARSRSPSGEGNPYRRYDWRPEGCNGKSKPKAARDMCPVAEAQVGVSCPSENIIPAGITCYGPRLPSRSRSPCNTHLDACKCIGSSSRPPGPSRNANPCDYRLCSASEPYSCKVSTAHKGMCSDSRNQQGLRPRSPVSTCSLEGPAKKPDMDAAGIITRNFEYPFPADFHSIIRLDSSLKHQGEFKNLGRIKVPPFGPRPGDIMILKIPRAHLSKDNGYVAFHTQRHTNQGFQLCPGDLLLRLGKFNEGNMWAYKCRYRLYQLTHERRWLLTGIANNFVDLLPLTTHTHSREHVDRHCRFFVPRRGDLIVQLNAEDKASQLTWFSPRTKDTLKKGDILVRAYLGSLQTPEGALASEVDAQVEIYMYTGKGFSWIYMGRDDCWLKDGHDVSPVLRNYFDTPPILNNDMECDSRPGTKQINIHGSCISVW